jgi:hypothetical protein
MMIQWPVSGPSDKDALTGSIAAVAAAHPGVDVEFVSINKLVDGRAVMTMAVLLEAATEEALTAIADAVAGVTPPALPASI